MSLGLPCDGRRTQNVPACGEPILRTCRAIRIAFIVGNHMAEPNAPRFPFLRAALRAIGLGPEMADQVVNFILELLAETDAPAAGRIWGQAQA